MTCLAWMLPDRLGRLVVLLPALAAWGLLQVGCGRSLPDLDTAAISLSRATGTLTEHNVRNVLRRITLVDYARHIDLVEVRVHGFVPLLLPGAKAVDRCDADATGTAPPKHCSCLSGDERMGTVDLPCWTAGAWGGKLTLEVNEITNSGGRGYLDWEEVCRVGSKLQHPAGSACVSGSALMDLRVQESSSPTRFDLLWMARLSFKDQDGTEEALDAVAGFVFEGGAAQPTLSRYSLIYKRNSFHYQGFAARSDGSATVTVVSRLGLHSCTLQRLARSGECRGPAGAMLTW